MTTRRARFSARSMSRCPSIGAAATLGVRGQACPLGADPGDTSTLKNIRFAGVFESWRAHCSRMVWAKHAWLRKSSVPDVPDLPPRACTEFEVDAKANATVRLAGVRAARSRPFAPPVTVRVSLPI
jgi:hypothetical protein